MLQRLNRFAAFISPRKAALSIVRSEQRKAAKLRAANRELRERLADVERALQTSGRLSSDVEYRLDSANSELARVQAENEILKMKLEDCLLWIESTQQRMKEDAAISIARRQAAINNTQPPKVTRE